jgi:hypothetical protein
VKRLLSRVLMLTLFASLPLAVTAGVTGTHGPDRGSGAVVSKPKPTGSEEASSEQTTKPEDKKEAEGGKGK